MTDRVPRLDEPQRRGRPREKDRDELAPAFIWGNLLRGLRESKFLTQAELASQIEELSGKPCKDSTISKWETGDNFPSRKYQPAICEILGIEHHVLFSMRIADVRGAA